MKGAPLVLATLLVSNLTGLYGVSVANANLGSGGPRGMHPPRGGSFANASAFGLGAGQASASGHHSTASALGIGHALADAHTGGNDNASASALGVGIGAASATGNHATASAVGAGMANASAGANGPPIACCAPPTPW